MSQLRVVHFVNQFFAGVGGEEKAGPATSSVASASRAIFRIASTASAL